VHAWQVCPGSAVRDPRAFGGRGDGAAALAGGDVGGRGQVAVALVPAVRAAEVPPGGLGYPVTLSGGGKTEILSMNAGWQQQWPQLVVQNLTFRDAYSGTQQTSGSPVYVGGAIFDEGGQLKVVNSAFLGTMVVRPNHCWKPRQPSSGCRLSTFSILGMAVATGSHLRIRSGWLKRIPIKKTTKSPSISAV
jgi:hypothetical protein